MSGKKLGIDRIKNAFETWGLDEDTLIGYPLEHRSEIQTAGTTEGILPIYLWEKAA